MKNTLRPCMQIRGIAWLILLACLAFAACAGPQPVRANHRLEHKSRPAIDSARLEHRIHELINLERKKQGLSPLAWDSALAAIARNHSRDMARRNYFSHYSPEDKDFSYRYKQAGYQCAVRVNTTIHLGAENILQNNLYDSLTTVNGEAFYDWNTQEKIAASSVQGWMNSTGHRKNILTPHWGKEGIGVVIAPDDKVYITQNFC